jgi:hypothetical protein
VPLDEGVHSAVLFIADEWGYEAVPVVWSFTVVYSEEQEEVQSGNDGILE